MRGITITYDYSGDEAPWRAAMQAFVDAVNSDPAAAGFRYQIAVADNGSSRIHWGRWDSKETLAHVQSQDYFTTFAAQVAEFSGGKHKPLPANIALKTENW
ncbi:hypothetical protein [Cognatishimia maritima]|uniref:Antibiotic biosynthesis monooxygenase n=1 Tax=Cognatishimia maritima TaxID=870908 RepID=A0A1M5NAG5_9RHOB|nr:hypothetical protein [Cognatishimia maritima]SHG86487.1 hypothetical protein SAMN04488044_1470 [Cognatishimia maritima]